MRRNEKMETNKLVAGIVATAIAVIVLAGVLMPALSDATTTHETFKNEGYYRMSKLTTSDEMTLFWDHTKPYEITVNDVAVALPESGTIWYTTIGSDEFLLRYIANDQAVSLFDQGTGISYLATAGNGTDMTITISNGSVTFDNGVNTPKTKTFTDYCFVVSPDGKYIMKDRSENAYVMANSEIRGIGRTTLPYSTTLSVSYNVSGTIKDGFEVDYFGTTETLTNSTPEVTATAVNGFKDLYSFDKLTWTATNSSNETATVTYSQVIVPYEVTAERAQHLEPAMNTILSVIPIIIIVAVLLGVVAIFIIRRE